MMFFLDIKNLKISFNFFFYFFIFLFSFRVWSETVPSSSQKKTGEVKIKIPDQRVEFKSPSSNFELSESSSDAIQNEAVQNETAQAFDPLPPELAEDSSVVEENPQVVEGESNIASPSDLLEDTASTQTVEGELKSSSVGSKVGKIKQLIPIYTYDPLFRKDPFAQPKESSDVPLEVGIHPIEDENVEDLKLRAIIWSRDGVIPRALFETKSGKTYTLSKNDRLKGGSIIYRVDTNRVWYMQPFVDPTTKQVGYKPNDIALSSQQKKELWYER